MMTMKQTTFTLLILFALLALVACNTTNNRAVNGAAITVEAPWARPAMAMEGDMGTDSATVSAAYMVLTNSGPQEDRLLSATSPAATAIEIHETTMDANNVMQMHPIEGGLVVPANSSVEMKPGGIHIMLIGLTQDIAVGGTVPLTLTFERAGTIEVQAEVREP